MRLFARIDKDEAQVAHPSAVFSWGKIYAWDPYNGRRGDVVGSYFRFILPFTVQKEYIDPNTFRRIVGPCRLWLIRHKHKKSGNIQWRHWWSPYL